MSGNDQQFMNSLRSGNFRVDQRGFSLVSQRNPASNSIPQNVANEQQQILNQIRANENVSNQQQQQTYPDTIDSVLYIVHCGKGAPINRTSKAIFKCMNNPVSVKASLEQILWINKMKWTTDHAVFGWNAQQLDDQKDKITTPSITIIDFDCFPGTVQWNKVKQFTLKQVEHEENNNVNNKKSKNSKKNTSHNKGLDNGMEIAEEKIREYFGDDFRQFNRFKKCRQVFYEAKYAIGVEKKDTTQVMEVAVAEMEAKFNKNKQKYNRFGGNNENENPNSNGLQNSLGMMVQLLLVQQLSNIASIAPQRAPSVPAPILPQVPPQSAAPVGPHIVPRVAPQNAPFAAPRIAATVARHLSVAAPPIATAAVSSYEAIRGSSSNIANVRSDPLNALNPLVNANNNNIATQGLQSYLASMLDGFK